MKSLGETQMRPTTMLFGNLLAMEVEECSSELLTIFSGIPTSTGNLFLTADATLASAELPAFSRGLSFVMGR
jgi:hypothetical protein